MLIKARACACEYVPQKRKENILHDLLSHVFALRLVRRLLLPFELRQLLHDDALLLVRVGDLRLLRADEW